MSFLFGVDIGGTKIAVAAVSTEGKIITLTEIETRAAEGAPRVIARLTAALHSIAQPETLLGIGIGCTGPVDPRTGHVMNPYTLPTWEDVDIVSPLAEEFQTRVVLENDCDAAALGEFWQGAAQGTQHAVYVTVGTGIGAGLILQGKLYRGVSMVVGEFGHTTIDYAGPACYCGAHGCLEMYAAGPAIARAYQSKTGMTHATARDVVQAAASGDADAIEVVERTAYYLGIGLANLISLLAPDVIVLGGGVMEHFELFQPTIRDTISKNVGLVPWQDVKITRAALGANAGVIGAAKGLLERLASTSPQPLS
jgi:glucokinase